MSQALPMVPASGKARWVIIAILVVLVAFSGYTAYVSQHVQFEVSETDLLIHGAPTAELFPPRASPALQINHAHPAFRVAFAGRDAFGCDLVDALEIFLT